VKCAKNTVKNTQVLSEQMVQYITLH